MSADMTVADVLDAAADYIRTFGLNKKDLGDHGGPRCALGAIDSAANEEWNLVDEAVATLAPVLRCRPLWPSIARWNDRKERRASQVITALMEAAARWRLENPGC